MPKKQKIAIVGATGAVGEELLNVLDELDFPVESILPLASAKSVGDQTEFRGRSYTTKEFIEDVFRENPVDIAFSSAGGSASEKYAKFAAEIGIVIIDSTSHFRMEKDTPLVAPECNPEDIKEWKKTGIIANSNYSTIQMVYILKPPNDALDLKCVDVSTYQAASGADKEGTKELVRAMQSFFAFKFGEFEAQTFPHTLALNSIPQTDVSTDNGYTKEELKMINKTQKIFHKNLKISVTCARVPVLRSHSEAVTMHLVKEVDVNEARDILQNAPSVVVIDESEGKKYPTLLMIGDANETYVGRIRLDVAHKNILHLWCVADQIHVGAATNAVRIAQKRLELENK